MNKTMHAIMVILISCTGQGENRYTKISINKIQELLVKIYGIHVKRRWIFFCLAYLITKGFITRKPRYRKKEHGFIRQISSMIWITVRGLKYLIRHKVEGSKKLLKHVIDGITNQDGRCPVKAIYNDGVGKLADPEERKRLEDLLGIVTEPI